MAEIISENVCKHNKYGYCKFQEKCRFQHVKQICPRKDCEIEKCSLRHPRECRYYREYSRCKFGSFCFYHHKDGDKVSENREIENKLNVSDEKQNELEHKLTYLSKLLEVKSEVIDNLDRKVNALEKTSQRFYSKYESV